MTDDLLSLSEVCKLTNLSKPTLYRRVKGKQFPAPVKVPTTAPRGPKLVSRWRKEDVVAYNLSLTLSVKKGEVEITIAVPKKWEAALQWAKRHEHALIAALGGFLAGVVSGWGGIATGVVSGAL